MCVWMDAMLAGSVHGGAVPVSAAFGLELEFFLDERRNILDHS